MARQKKGRKVNGILLLDKPAGISSNQALQRIKRLYNAQKAGHTGNLDGPATGLLPVCLGEATKMSTFLLDAKKSYRADVRLGITTTTADATGEIIEEKPVPVLTPEALETVLEKFRGTITQIPPMYSALKHQGERLHKLARQGVDVERKPRTQEIYQLHASNLKEDGFCIDVDCSKGTYIRTLAEDIGKALGCGAHVLTLRRTAVGCFRSGSMHSIENLEALKEDQAELDKLLLPMDSGLQCFPEVVLDDVSSAHFLNGQAIQAEIDSADLVRVYHGTTISGGSGRFLGIGQSTTDGLIRPKRLIVWE